MSGPAFRYARAADAAGALALGSEPGAAFVAGGTDLLQLWKVGVATPAQVVDISRLPLTEVAVGPEGLRLGAL
ncbi:MAG TPA: FAD binding domain-containing protein, partial [Phenylobacterium sp.]|nr:FAD binding domain-containing protein [Phenylobacterium sp.]